MAGEKKVTNQAAIDAANRQNANATQRKAQLESAAAAAFEKSKPIISQAISGTKNLAAAVNAQVQALANPGGIYDPISGKVVKTPAQLKSEADTAKAAATGVNKYGGLTPEQIELSKVYAKERTDALEEAEKITFVNVPGAVYDTTGTSKTGVNSAYDLLLSQFQLYGLEALVTPLKDLITDDTSAGELTLLLRSTEPYKKRFAANPNRISKGLRALSEAEYLTLEDSYQKIMRNYGLPETYYTKGDLGRQEGFEKLIGFDVSATELEDRIMTAQQRVLNSNPEVLASLKAFYPDITNGDILAYTLDPKNALTDIKRKVTAAEIGGAATQAGLKTGMERAQELGAAGVTKEVAQKGFRTVAEIAPRGGELAAMYGESPYTQQTAEQEIFGLAGSADAAKQRKKLVGLERAEFSGQAGTAQGALGRERAGNF